MYCKKTERAKGIAQNVKLRDEKYVLLNMPDLYYVSAHCQKDGVYLVGTETKPKQEYVMRYQPDGRVWLPGSIINAYDLNNGAFTLIRLKEAEYFIEKECSEVPHPPIGSRNVDCSKVDTDELYPVTKKEQKHCYMATQSFFQYGKLFIPYANLKVTVHMGGCLRIDVTAPTEKELQTFPSIHDLESEYKMNFGGCCADQLAFIYKREGSGSMHGFPVPKPFRLMAGLSKGSSLDAFVGPEVNGFRSYVFAPKEGTCAFDGKKIDPKREVPEKAVLCESCSDGIEDIRPLLERFDVLNGMVQNFRDQIEESEAKLAEAQDEIKASRNLNRRLAYDNEKLCAENEDLKNQISEVLGRIQKIEAVIGGAQ